MSRADEPSRSSKDRTRAAAEWRDGLWTEPPQDDVTARPYDDGHGTAGAYDDDGHGTAGAYDDDPAGDTWLDEEDGELWDEPATPPVAPVAPARRARRGTGRRAGRRGAVRPPGPPPRRRHGGYWRRRFGALLGLLGIGAALWFINAIFQPFHGPSGVGVRVSVPDGASARDIGEVLASRGVVDSGAFFEINATLTNRRGKLRAGDYTLARGMSYGDAIEALMQGPKVKVVETFEVTVPEGRSRRETQPILREAGIRGSYLRATASSRLLRRAREHGLPRRAESAEGFLFPATYELEVDARARDLAERQVDAFGRAMRQVDLRKAKRRNLTRYDVTIIASMVEREASLDRERPLVAAVIHNRLREGMPLGIDATIRYAEDNWTEPLKESELTRPGPYNTRLNAGLPPTPIGNPGLASLKAAADPADEDYLFYVVKPNACGEHNFSSTDAEFQRDVAAYNAARERAGGRSPTTC